MTDVNVLRPTIEYRVFGKFCASRLSLHTFTVLRSSIPSSEPIKIVINIWLPSRFPLESYIPIPLRIRQQFSAFLIPKRWFLRSKRKHIRWINVYHRCYYPNLHPRNLSVGFVVIWILFLFEHFPSGIATRALLCQWVFPTDSLYWLSRLAACAMSGCVVIDRYRRAPTSFRYGGFFPSSLLHGSDLHTFTLLSRGVDTGLQSNIPNLRRTSCIYPAWCTRIPSSYLSKSIPKQCFSSPRSFTSSYFLRW